MISPASGESAKRPKGVIRRAVWGIVFGAATLVAPPAVLIYLGGVPDPDSVPSLEEVRSALWWSANYGDMAVLGGIVLSWMLYLWWFFAAALTALRALRSSPAARPSKWANQMVTSILALTVRPNQETGWLEGDGLRVEVTEVSTFENLAFVVGSKGATLDEVARMAGGGHTWADVASANPDIPRARTYRIKHGTRLSLPPSKTAAAEAAAEAAVEAEVVSVENVVTNTPDSDVVTQPIVSRGGESAVAAIVEPHTKNEDDGTDGTDGGTRKGGWGFVAQWKAVSAASGSGLTALRHMVDRRRKVDVFVAARSAAETLRVVAVMDGPDGVYALSDRIAPPPPEESGWILTPDDDRSWLLPRKAPAPLTSRGTVALMPVGTIGQSVFYVNLDCVALVLEGDGGETVREYLNGWARGMPDPSIWEEQEGDVRTVWKMETERDGSVYFPELQLALIVTPPPPDYDPVIVQTAPPVVQVTQTHVAQVVGVIDASGADLPGAETDPSSVLKITADKDMARDIVRGEMTDDHAIDTLLERMEERKKAKEKEAAEAAKKAAEAAEAREEEGGLDSDFDFVDGEWVAKPGSVADVEGVGEDTGDRYDDREDVYDDHDGDGYDDHDGDGYDDHDGDGYDDHDDGGYDDHDDGGYDDHDDSGYDDHDDYYDREDYDDHRDDGYGDREDRYDDRDDYGDREDDGNHDGDGHGDHDRDKYDDDDYYDDGDDEHPEARYEHDEEDEEDGYGGDGETDRTYKNGKQKHDIEPETAGDGPETENEGKETDMETGEAQTDDPQEEKQTEKKPPAPKRGKSEIGKALLDIKRRLDRLTKK